MAQILTSRYEEGEPEIREPLISQKSVVMFGDSITFQGNWENLLGRQDIVNCGKPGYTTGQLNWTIKDIFSEHQATKIWFLQGGVNDISLGIPIARILENQKAAIESLRGRHIIPVLQATTLKRGDPEFNRLVEKLNRKLKRICVQNAIDFLDVNEFLSEGGELTEPFSADGCHLTPDAYVPWGVAVKMALVRHAV